MDSKEKILSQFSLNREILSWKSVFCYRDLWMSAAIILILLYHAPYISFPGRLMTFIHTISYCGVDIFLFASGIGCWFSFSKDRDILRFLKRRFQRIMPVTFLCLALWAVYCRITGAPLTIGQFIGNLFGQTIIANQGSTLNWNISCLFLFYFCVPFFAALAERYPSFPARCLITLCILLFTIPFWGTWSLIFWSRISIFFIGICVGQTSTRKSGLTLGFFLLSLLGTYIGLELITWIIRTNKDWLISYGGWWYPFILAAPGICFLMSLVASSLEKTPLRHVIKLCMKIGEYTLPLSLVHVMVYQIYETWLEKGLCRYSWGSLSCAVLLTFVVSIGLQKGTQLLQRYRR